MLREHILVLRCVRIASGRLLVHSIGGVRGVRRASYVDVGACIQHISLRTCFDMSCCSLHSFDVIVVCGAIVTMSDGC